MRAAWAAAYIGIPYLYGGSSREGADCWGLVRLVQREVFGREIDDYPHGGGTLAKLSAEVQDAKPLVPVDKTGDPKPGDLVLLRIFGFPTHVGVVVGDGAMLHTLGKHAAVLEQYDGLRWSERIEGFYRVKA